MMDYMIYSRVDREELVEKLKGHKERYIQSIDALKAAWGEKNEAYKIRHDGWYGRYAAETLESDEKEPRPPVKMVDKTDDYELYIDLYEASVDDFIDLSVQDFNGFWRDNWTWMKNHKNNISAYWLSASSVDSEHIYSDNVTANLSSAYNAYDISGSA